MFILTRFGVAAERLKAFSAADRRSRHDLTIAQLVERSTVVICSHRMVTGSIPVGEIFLAALLAQCIQTMLQWSGKRGQSLPVKPV